MQNKGIKIVSGLFFIAFILDLISTLMLGELVQYLEANLIYKYVGLIGISALNILMLAFLYWRYNKGGIHARYVSLNILLLVVIIRIFVIINNYQIYLNPPTLQAAKQITQAAKTAAITQAAWVGILPYAIGIIAFYFFSLDHNIEVKE